MLPAPTAPSGSGPLPFRAWSLIAQASQLSLRRMPSAGQRPFLGSRSPIGLATHPPSPSLPAPARCVPAFQLLRADRLSASVVLRFQALPFPAEPVSRAHGESLMTDRVAPAKKGRYILWITRISWIIPAARRFMLQSEHYSHGELQNSLPEYDHERRSVSPYARAAVRHAALPGTCGAASATGCGAQ